MIQKHAKRTGRKKGGFFLSRKKKEKKKKGGNKRPRSLTFLEYFILGGGLPAITIPYCF